jgi:long-subunit acyl-CoA synthetase (AMP-forming)
VVGDRKPYNVALLIVDPEAASAWAAAHGRAGEAYALTVADPSLREAVAQEVSVANARLSHVEQVRRWQLMDAEWLPDGDELTATMKLKRRPISEKHAATIERLYL